VPAGADSGRPAPVLSGEGGRLVVTDVRTEALEIVSLRLEDPDNAALPSWEPGAHIDLLLPSGRIRQYSLCGSPDDVTSYRVAVLLEPVSRGGSTEVHEQLTPGTVVGYYGPSNYFALEEAPSYLLLAGGIGITPILPMATRLRAEALPFRLVYGARSRERMAFRDEVEALGGDVELLAEDEAGRPDLAALLGSVYAGTAVYVCGPAGMLAAVGEAWPARLLPGSLHFERFSPGDGVDPLSTGLAYGEFFVELARQHKTLRVPANRSILAVVWEAFPEVNYSCTHGSCGRCETRVLEGEPIHRDAWLTREERKANESMMICVGRSKSPLLVLDL